MNITPDPGPRLEVEGGTASNVIELTNGPGEPEPQVSITPLVSGVSRLSTPRQPIRIGHVAGNVRSAAQIYTDGAVIPPKDARFINCDCPDCDSELVVLPHQEPGVFWLVIEHSASCPALAAWTRRAS